ncbi:MAG: type II CAAX endopeptidase family protein [Parvularculaceae bacterium]
MRQILISTGKILLFLALWAGLTSASLYAALQVGGEAWFEDLRARYVFEVGAALGAFLALMIMAFLIDKRGWGTLGLRLSAAPMGLILGALIGAIIFAIPLLILMAMGAAQFAPDFGRFTSTALFAGLGLCLFNVFNQQLLVRSYIFQELWAKYGAWTAAIVTTVIFVALHAGPIASGPLGIVAGLNVALASLMLSFAYVRTRQLWLPIGIHFGWNGLQGPILHINVTGADIALGDWRVFTFNGPDLWTGGALGVEGGLAGLAGPLVGFALVMLLTKKAV